MINTWLLLKREFHKARINYRDRELKETGNNFNSRKITSKTCWK